MVFRGLSEGIIPLRAVREFMVPFEKLHYAPEGVKLNEANDMIWAHKLNALPVVDKNQRLVAFVFRKDYSSHKDNPLELLDDSKRYVVGGEGTFCVDRPACE